MYVIGIGEVTQCNKNWIFTNEDGAQDRIAASAERLQAILQQAVEDETFYSRMWNELHAEYERRLEAVRAKYKYITDDDVKAAYERSDKDGWLLSIQKDSHNRECADRHAAVFGLYDGVTLAAERQAAARKLRMQARDALKK